MAEEGVEVGPEVKKEIAEKFLSLAPPGEFADVEKAVRKLVDDDDIVDSIVETCRKRYNEDQLVAFDLEHEGKQIKALVCPEGQQEGSYTLPSRGIAFDFDHQSKVATNVRQMENAPTGDNFTALSKGLATYLDDAFFASAGDVFPRSDNEFTVLFSGSKFNAKNMWNGRWRSRYEVIISGDSLTISGDASVLVHYFEDGNVQMNAKKSFAETVSTSGDIEKSLASALQKFENGFHTTIVNANKDLSETSFRELRRRLPINKQKFDWERSTMHRLAKELPK